MLVANGLWAVKVLFFVQRDLHFFVSSQEPPKLLTNASTYIVWQTQATMHMYSLPDPTGDCEEII